MYQVSVSSYTVILTSLALSVVSPSNRLSCTLDWRIISFLVLSFHVTCLQFIAPLDAARLLNLKLYFIDNLLASPHVGFLASLKTNPAPLTFFVLVTHQT
jgi:hypothetical protein